MTKLNEDKIIFTSTSFEEDMYWKVMSHSACVIELEQQFDNMNYPDADELVSAISIANFHDGENVAIECMKCNEVIIEFNRPEEETD